MNLAKSLVLGEAVTENGAQAFASTGSEVLNFFALAGGLRLGERIGDAPELFNKAFNENPQLALKALFFLRDIREGAGEREVFRKVLTNLASRFKLTKEFVKLIPEYGRWDDLYALANTPSWDVCSEVIKEQLEADLVSANPSLLAKWLKSENATSSETKALGKLTRNSLGVTPRVYRKMLTAIRSKLNIVETNLTDKAYDRIEYSKVPSKAMLRYNVAFSRNDCVNFSKFTADVAAGKTKINTGTLAPYEVIRSSGDMALLWNNLPDYVNGKNILVVADVSGSMEGTPMDVSVSLAIYCAERNGGDWKNMYCTFSDDPKFLSIEHCTTIQSKISQVMQSDWGMSTNIEKVFTTLCNGATSQSDLPDSIVIVSDMEFNAAVQGAGSDGKSLFQGIDRMFAKKGLAAPSLVFWNVAARNTQFPSFDSASGATLLSGCSAKLFEYVASGSKDTPMETMLRILTSERYNSVSTELLYV